MTSKKDHQRTLDLLHIATIRSRKEAIEMELPARQGRGRRNPQAAALVLLVRKYPDTAERLDRVAAR
jgi:hypothetical protein